VRHRVPILLLILAPVLFASTSLRPRSFLAARVVSGNGAYYVCMYADGRFVYCRADPDSERPSSCWIWRRRGALEDARVAEFVDPRPQDEVVAAGSLPFHAFHVLVSSSGLGFAALWDLSCLEHALALILVDSGGTFLRRYEVGDLYSPHERSLLCDRIRISERPTGWLGGWLDSKDAYVDEAARTLVLLPREETARCVSFVTGEVRDAPCVSRGESD